MTRLPSPGGSGGGKTYTYRQLEQLWISAGGPRRLARTMAAIAMAESGGYTLAHNASGASGLWQILGAPANWHRSNNWFNAHNNALAAVAKYRQQGLGAWTTYTSGAYKSYLQNVTVAPAVHGGEALIREAEKFIGVPYVWGGASPKGFDCSGLVQYSLEKIGVKNVPRNSAEQWAWVQHIHHSQLRPGDLIFEQWPGDNVYPGHVVIYAGHGEIIQAPQTGQNVEKVPFSPQLVAQQGGQVVGYGRVPGIGKGAFSGSSSSSQSQSQSQNGTPWYESVLQAVASVPLLGSAPAIQGVASSTSEALSGLTTVLTKAEQYINWWFVPGHIIRIVSGILGTGLVAVGIFSISRTGRSYSVEVPVVNQRLPTPVGGQLAPAIGIAEVTVGSILLFVAFHNLPANVTNFPMLLNHLHQELATGGHPNP